MKGRFHEDDGVAAVEMAILVPFLALMVFGLVELAFALNVHKSVQEAVGEGVLHAAYRPAQPSETKSRVVEAISSPQLSLSDVSVTCPTSSSVTVTVTHSHALFTPIVSNLLGGAIAMDIDATGQVLSSTATCVASP